MSTICYIDKYMYIYIMIMINQKVRRCNMYIIDVCSIHVFIHIFFKTYWHIGLLGSITILSIFSPPSTAPTPLQPHQSFPRPPWALPTGTFRRSLSQPKRGETASNGALFLGGIMVVHTGLGWVVVLGDIPWDSLWNEVASILWWFGFVWIFFT